MSNLSIMQDKKSILLEFDKYPDGTENLKTIVGLSTSKCYLNVKIKDPNRDLFRILLAREALKVAKVENVVLNIPYLPHARADRVFSSFHVSPLKVFCQVINSLGFSEVLVEDIHSHVTLQELMCSRSSLNIPSVPSNVGICAPDQGSIGRASKFAEVNSCEVIYCTKQRDIETGVPTVTEIKSPVAPKGQEVLIVDDICDGGGTFIALAKELKGMGYGKVGLFVTHGIFSKGFRVFDDVIDEITCNNIIGSYVTAGNILDFNSKVDR